MTPPVDVLPGAGFAPDVFAAAEQSRVPALGVGGGTSLVTRPTARAAELSTHAGTART